MLEIIGACITTSIFIGCPVFLFRSCIKKNEVHRFKYYNPRKQEELYPGTNYLYLNDSVYEYSVHLDTVYKYDGNKKKQNKSYDEPREGGD